MLGLIIVITFLVYAPSLNNEFVNFDDSSLIIHNRLVTGGSEVDFEDFFKKNLHNAHFKPLVFWSWNIEYRLFADNPLFYHLNNLVLHILNSLLVFLILLKLSRLYVKDPAHARIIAFFVSLVFAVHPIHVESVAWAVERKDVMFSFFYLLGMLSYLKYIEKTGSKWIVVSIVCYGLAILTKSMSVTLFVVTILIDYIYKRKVNIRLLLEKIPYLIILITGFQLYGILGNFAIQTAGLTGAAIGEGALRTASNFEGLSPFYTRILVLNIRFILWLAHAILPINLSVIYPRIAILESLGGFIHLFPWITAGLVFLAIYFRKKAGYLLFGLLFYLITISPALAITEIGTSVFLSDRYEYLALMGLFFGLVTGIFKIGIKSKSNRLFFGIMIIILIAYAIGTMGRVKVWKNSETLWTDVINKYKSVATAYHNRATYYNSINKDDKALEDYSYCLLIAPNRYKTLSNRGRIYFESGKDELAMADLNRAIELNQDFAEAYANRGCVLGKTANYEMALHDLNKAIELNPRHKEAHMNRALTYFNLQQFENAIPDCDFILERNPGDARIYDLRGTCKRVTGLPGEAVLDYTAAIGLDPLQGILYLNRSLAYDALGEYSQALNDALKAKELGAPVEADYLSGLQMKQ